MSTANREQSKIYLAIGLAMLFIAVGYFRFFHGTIAPAKGNARGAGTPVRVEVPTSALPDMLLAPTVPSAPPEPPRTMLRNIFFPGRESSTGRAVPAAPAEPEKPLPSLKLSGTITGGTRPMALINGRSLRLGEKIEGFQVISITRTQVSLESGGRRMLLKVLEAPESGMP